MPTQVKKEEKMETEPKVVEIDEEVETVEEELDITGLSDKEVKMGTDQGTIKEKNEHKELPKPEAKTDPEEEEHPKVEDVEKDENKLKKYNKNEQALYWKYKTDKYKRQEAQKQAAEAKSQAELEQVKNLALKQKLEKIKAELSSGKDISAEDLLRVVNDGQEEDKPVAKPDPAVIAKEKISVKVQFAEKIGQAKYDNFIDIAKLAKEVIDGDTSKTYQRLMDEAFTNDDVDENMLVERIVSIAKLDKRFSELKSAPAEKKGEAEKVIKNAAKKPSSASVNNAGGKRIVSEDELTVSEAQRLSTDQWGKLSDRTRTRILKGINP